MHHSIIRLTMKTMQKNLLMKNVLAISQHSLPYLPYLFHVLDCLGLHRLLQNNAKKKLVYAKCWVHQYTIYGKCYQKNLRCL